MSTEIELKLEVDPADLPLVLQDPILAKRESHSGHQVTVYYDTPETALKKHGFTLRVRSTGDAFVQTIKPITDRVGFLSREEIDSEVSSIRPDLSQLAQHPIHALVGDGTELLEEKVRSDVKRTSWIIERGNGQIQVDLDLGTITANERCVDFAEVEFELREGAPASLIVAARRLSDQAPVRLGVLTKAERGFLLAKNQLGKVHKADRVCVRGDMNVSEAFQTIVHACLKHYRLNEPLVLRECKAGALHQARVAMRRLRSAFSLFRPAVEDVEFQHLRSELRWFTAQLGDARNLDVYLERDLPEKDRERALRKRQRAYDRVIDAMNSHKFRRLLIDIAGWTAIGAWRSSKGAHRPIESFANRRLDRLWRSITVFGRNLADMDEQTRHLMRIQIKKLRYAMEFFQEIHVDARVAEKRFASAVQEVQESLGKLNDMATAKSFGATSPEQDWLIGTLGERKYSIVAEEALRDLLRTGPFWRMSRKLVASPEIDSPGL